MLTGVTINFVPLGNNSKSGIFIVAVGVSTGGPNALAEVIPHFSEDFPVPIVIVQHMPPDFTAPLADSLDAKSALSVKEAEDGMFLQAGSVYIAPGGMQMKVERRGGYVCLRITDDPAENHCKPAADYLFRSVAEVYGRHALGVIMTGMGKDGAAGLREMKRFSAQVIAQDQESCSVFGMPMEAIKAGVVDVVLPLAGLAGAITRKVYG